MKNNTIKITLEQNAVNINIGEDIEDKEITQILTNKIVQLKKLYKDDVYPIKITGKLLKNKQINEIQELILKYIDTKIEFESPKVLGLHGIKKTFDQKIDISEAKFHKGSLRSGQKIEFEGSLIILGDVNGGAEVIAGENIVILGVLRGLAHAGAKGNKKAIIAAGAIQAPQIRIADKIQEAEKYNNYNEIIGNFSYINDKGEVVIE